ncbi:TetR/AcrR family transcriptional regulator [Sphingobium sp. Sx8-8]|uniref:TetR/AcrR family transcriptional regulator n=1 Tax=Sphingobium sp. Sx8-8 TaxID=2933617 RepID=UPI001F59623E|nr:TetR/AcrR family transcriptional regulator [Sphingobium sp. Sx8-8]
MNTRIPTSQRLIYAAIPLIWRHGYNAVSVDAICEAAVANKGSFYHAFRSKAELLTRAIDVVWQQDGAELTAIVAQPANAASRLDAYLDWFLDSQRRLSEQMGFVPGHFHMAIDINVPEAAAAANAHRLEARALIQSLLRDALEERMAPSSESDWLADTIGHIVSGLMIEARLGNSLEPISALKPTVHRMLDHVSSSAA